MNTQILLPGLVLGIYTLMFVGYMAVNRFRAVGREEVDPAYYALYQDGAETERLRVITRHFSNLLELPLLFYIILVIISISGLASPLLIALAWLYVALRFLHAYIHLGSNIVLNRFRAYGASVVVLLAIWVITAAGIVMAG